MLRSPKTNQRQERQLTFRLDGTGTAALTIGSGLGTLVDNGVGDYTITFHQPFARLPGAWLQTITSAKTARAVVTTTSIQVLTFAPDGTTPADSDVDIRVIGWDTVDEYKI